MIILVIDRPFPTKTEHNTSLIKLADYDVIEDKVIDATDDVACIYVAKKPSRVLR